MCLCMKDLERHLFLAGLLLSVLSMSPGEEKTIVIIMYLEKESVRSGKSGNES